ncbi:MAG: hypothetical protein ABSC18_07470 [Verrucomicrobiota bacterium]|jgi:hypothetical protein
MAEIPAASNAILEARTTFKCHDATRGRVSFENEDVSNSTQNQAFNAISRKLGRIPIFERPRLGRSLALPSPPRQ